MHPNLCAVYAVHRLYSAFFSIKLQYSTQPAMIQEINYGVTDDGGEWNCSYFMKPETLK